MSIQHKLLTISIPTYNRANELDKNLGLITEIIHDNQLESIVDIVVSDNCSTDNTRVVLEKYEKCGFLKSYYQEKNTGPYHNILYVISVADGDYVMLIGDDDFMTSEFLCGVISILNQYKTLDCIIPNFVNMMPDGTFPNKSRDYGVASHFYPKGMKSCKKLMCKAHQMSGLVFSKKGIADYFDKNSIYTMYPQIVMTAMKTLHGDAYHYTEFPIKVSQPGQAKKFWSYGKDGLISDVLGGLKGMSESYVTRTILQCVVVKTNISIIKKYDTWWKRRVFVWTNFSSRKTMFMTKFYFLFWALVYDFYFLLKRTPIYTVAKRKRLKEINSLPEEHIH